MNQRSSIKKFIKYVFVIHFLQVVSKEAKRSYYYHTSTAAVATGPAPIDLYYIVNNCPIVAITKLIHLMLFIFFKKAIFP